MGACCATSMLHGSTPEWMCTTCAVDHNGCSIASITQTRAKQTLNTYHLQAWAAFKVSSREQQPRTVSPIFNNGPETRSCTHDAAAHS